MRIETIFEYRDYKVYLADRMRSKLGGGRGERTRLAAAIHCHAAYISLVLKGDANFSLEQGEAINTYLGHTDEECHFFLLLIQLERAGTKRLRNYFSRQIRQVIEGRTILKNRLKFKKNLSVDDQSTYYNAWYYAAIHIMLGVPELQTKEAIHHYLRLPRNTISEVLNFLISAGLAIENKGRFETGTTSVHLGGESKNIARGHVNWRLRALAALERPPRDDFHYSSVVSMSRPDFESVKSILVRAIEEVRNKVENSPEEEVFCYSLDFFTLKESD